MPSLKHFVLLFTLYGVIESKQFRYDYTSYPSIDGYLKLHIVPATWEDARLTCGIEGGILASPSNENMKNALDSEIEKSTILRGIYTGVNSIDSKGYFYSIEGVSLDDMPLQWLPGEPNNAGGDEYCIVYENGRVADAKCTKLLPFICYKKGKEIAKPICDTVETGSDRCYKLHPVTTTWPEAQRVCVASGGYLAVINSKEEAESVSKLVSSSKINAVFIGFQDWSGRGDWRTVQGQTLEEAGYAVWSRGYPSFESEANCGAISTKDGTLVNYWCKDPRALAPFLCEIPLK